MTCDEIIRMARKAAARHGHTLKEQPSPETVEFITELAAMAAAAERKACAKLCDDEAEQFMQCAGSMTTGAYDWKADGATDCAEAIRARGQK